MTVDSNYDVNAKHSCTVMDNGRYRMSYASSFLLTHGGYDWSSFIWSLNISELCEPEHGTGAWILDAVLPAMVNRQQQAFNHPPLHLHHLAISEDSGKDSRPNPDDAFYGFRGWEVHLQTGELTCGDIANPFMHEHCSIVEYDPPKKIPGALVGSAEVNDVRPNGSLPIRWQLRVQLFLRPLRDPRQQQLWLGKRQVYPRFAPSEYFVTG